MFVLIEPIVLFLFSFFNLAGLVTFYFALCLRLVHSNIVRTYERLLTYDHCIRNTDPRSHLVSCYKKHFRSQMKSTVSNKRELTVQHDPTFKKLYFQSEPNASPVCVSSFLHKRVTVLIFCTSGQDWNLNLKFDIMLICVVFRWGDVHYRGSTDHCHKTFSIKQHMKTDKIWDLESFSWLEIGQIPHNANWNYMWVWEKMFSEVCTTEVFHVYMYYYTSFYTLFIIDLTTVTTFCLERCIKVQRVKTYNHTGCKPM